ncbi:MAG: hypothetical protein ACRCVN_06180 [Spirochaetia bacterium]
MREKTLKQTIYHGTKAQFDQFDEAFLKRHRFGVGFYFANNKRESEKFMSVSGEEVSLKTGRLITKEVVSAAFVDLTDISSAMSKILD